MSIHGFPNYTEADKQFMSHYLNKVEESITGETERSSAPSQNSYSMPAQSTRTTYVDKSTNIAVGNNSGNTTTYASGTSQRHLSEEEEEVKRKREAEKTAAIWGGISTVGGAGLLAYFGRAYQNAKKNNGMTQKVLNGLQSTQLLANTNHYNYIAIYGKLRQIVDIQVDYDKAKLNKSTNDLLATATLLGSVISIFLGGLYKKEGMRNLGYVGLIAGLASIMFNQVWHWNDPRSETDINELKTRIRELRTNMGNSQSWNVRISSPSQYPQPPGYSPSAPNMIYPQPPAYPPPFPPGHSPSAPYDYSGYSYTC